MKILGWKDGSVNKRSCCAIMKPQVRIPGIHMNNQVWSPTDHQLCVWGRGVGSRDRRIVELTDCKLSSGLYKRPIS